MGGPKMAPFPKICHTYPAMMELGTVIPYLKKMHHVTHPLSFADTSIFLLEISKFCYIKKYRYRFHLDTQFLIPLTFLDSLRISLINMVTILMMSAKMATPDLLKTDFLKKRLWHHNFCPWHHQQNFIT